MTRAQRRLVITSARRRTLFGQTMENGPSPFLEGLPRDAFIDASARPRRKRGGQLTLF
jgi:superfamily I DNA/RNA helicase